MRYNSATQTVVCRGIGSWASKAVFAKKVTVPAAQNLGNKKGKLQKYFDLTDYFTIQSTEIFYLYLREIIYWTE